ASAAIACSSTRRAPRWWAPVVLALPLAGWSVVAAAAAGDVGGAAPVLGILFGVVAAAVVGLTAGDSRDLLVDGLLWIGAGVALLGWAGVVWRVHPLAMIETGLWRAASVLTYENATAALLAPLALVALARAAARPERAADRLMAMVLVVGVGVTLSRAGWAGLGVGLVVLAVCIPVRRLLPVVPRALAASAVAIAGVVAVSPASAHRGALVPVVALAAGAAICVVRVPRHRRAAAVIGVVLASVVIVAGAVVGRGASTFRTSRLSVASADRDNEWRATAAVARRHLLTGIGPSHLVIQWVDATGQVAAAKETHNEYLQLAAEEGVVAPTLVVGALAVVARTLGRRTKRDRHANDWLVAGALAGVAALVVHSAFDFVWHVPVVPLVVAALAGAALASDSRACEVHELGRVEGLGEVVGGA
ncbi:MAG: hypothetical protein JWP02_1422, partial [Acidimicrobiales bacterium]|nr:hypothetical protein [Acidimicrobiales bacterium]